MHKTLTSRLIGFIGSLLFTLTAFLLILHPEFLHLDIQMTFFILLILAVLQSMVQSIFFLNILSEEGPRWNLMVFTSTISILLIILIGSIWIMNHLDYNMMPR